RRLHEGARRREEIAARSFRSPSPSRKGRGDAAAPHFPFPSWEREGPVAKRWEGAGAEFRYYAPACNSILTSHGENQRRYPALSSPRQRARGVSRPSRRAVLGKAR